MKVRPSVKKICDKCKNPKHLAATSTVLDSGSMSTNRALRQAIAKFIAANN